MAQYKDGTYIVKDGELYKIDIKVKFPADGITVPLSDFIKKTNADRIRSMTDEELMQFCVGLKTYEGCPNHGLIDCQESCGKCWLDWLRKEAKDG